MSKGFERIETVYKPNSQSPGLHTLAGEMLIKREKKPIITSQKIAEADIMLFQLSGIIDFTANRDCHYRWFPITYIYAKNTHNMWTKLKSKKYCEKILPLFGVSSVDELKNKIGQSKNDGDIGYFSNIFNPTAPRFSDIIKIEEIASIN